MKNIHLILANKAVASLYHCSNTRDLFTTRQTPDDLLYEVYITSSDEEIKEGDYVINNLDKLIGKSIRELNSGEIKDREYSKIILTTDQDLIKDGVQAIDDEFLEWFVKNPLCGEVGVTQLCKIGCNKLILNGVNSICCGDKDYKIFIPKEEPKQETLEEAAESKWSLEKAEEFAIDKFKSKYKTGTVTWESILEVLKVGVLTGHKFGAKWQQERMYSREDMINFAEFVTGYPDKNRNQLGQILHAKSRYDGAERTSDLLMIWADLGRTAKDQTV